VVNASAGHMIEAATITTYKWKAREDAKGDEVFNCIASVVAVHVNSQKGERDEARTIFYLHGLERRVCWFAYIGLTGPWICH
jgi:hypothetical protein